MAKRKKESMLSLRPFKRISRSRSRSPHPPRSSNSPAAAPPQTVQASPQPVPEIEATTPFLEIGNALVRKVWQEAFDQLPLKEQKILQDIPDQSAPIEKHIDAMLTSVRAKQQQCHKKQWTFRFKGQPTRLRDRVEKIIYWLDRYKQVGDVAVNSNPLMAGLPWAGVRFLLQAAVSESQLMTSLLLGVDSATYVLARCRAYECVYLYDQPSTEAEIRTQRAIYFDLREMYTLVLEFLASANELYIQTTFGRALKAFWDIEEINSFDKKIKDNESRLNKDAQSLIAARNQTVAVQILEELADLRNLSDAAFRMDDRVNTLWMRSERDHRAKILEWVSKIPYADDHYRARYGRTEGTGEWTSSDQSMILWVNGIPGAGKTKLASKVIDEFHPPKPDYGVAYFYCSRKQSDSTPRDNPDDILRSFIRQLAVRNECIHTLLSDIHQKKLDSGSSALRAEECKMLILELTKTYSKTFLVLDALDESDKEKRLELLDIFNDLIEESEQLKILIFSRLDDDIKYQLERKNNIGIEATDNQNDIQLFVKEVLRDIQKKRRNPLSEKLCQRITEVLLEKSQGMFQWAALQLEQISRLKRECDIETELGYLPRTLTAVYDEIFQQISGAEGSQPEIGRRAIHWVAACPTTNPDTLVAVVCQNLNTDVTDPIHISIEDVLDACRNLVVIYKNKCIFSHLSVREYIEEGLNGPWTLAQAHATVAEVCLSLLCNNLWENREEMRISTHSDNAVGQFRRYVHQPKASAVLCDLLDYARKRFPRHLNKCGEPQSRRLHRLYEKFFGTFAEPAPAFKRWRRTLGGAFQVKQRLMELGFPNSDPTSLGLFEVVCAFEFAGYLEYELRHGRFHPHQLQNNAVDVLAYVALSTSNRTMGTLLEGVGDNNHHNLSLGKALTVAAYSRNATMVQLLLGTKVNVDIVLSTGRFPCPLAAAVASWPNGEVAQLLVRARANVNLSLTGLWCGTILCAAACDSDVDALELIIEAGAKVNMAAVNGDYGSALCAAAYFGYAANIGLLVGYGAEVNMPLVNGQFGSALCAAVHKRDTTIIELLLKVGAKVNMPLVRGLYGGALIASLGHESAEITQILLDAEANGSTDAYRDGSTLHDAARRYGLKFDELEFHPREALRHCDWGLLMAIEVARHDMREEDVHLELVELLRQALGSNSDLKTLGRHPRWGNLL